MSLIVSQMQLFCVLFICNQGYMKSFTWGEGGGKEGIGVLVISRDLRGLFISIDTLL